MEEQEYARQCAQVRQLMNRLHYRKAEALARQLASDDPMRLEAVILWNLAACANGGALDRSAIIIRMAEKRGASSLVLGDMLRDRAKTSITFGWLDSAETFLRQATELHADDLNRLACLEGIQGRLCHARGDLSQAVQSHIRADQAWFGIGEQANQIWVRRNQVALTLVLTELSEQTARRVIAADHRERGLQHIVLCGISVMVPLAGWRLAKCLTRVRR